jgi:hypothetical protein
VAPGPALRTLGSTKCSTSWRKGLERGWSAPQLAAAHAVSVSCVCRALARENLLTTAQAIKQQMRVRYPEYFASPAPSPANVSVSGNARP